MIAVDVDAHAAAAQARARLARNGWREIAHGDWPWVLESPDGAQAARVTPWDPAHRLHVALCMARPGRKHLPRIDQAPPLTGEGYIAVMERLAPCAAAARGGHERGRP